MKLVSRIRSARWAQLFLVLLLAVSLPVLGTGCGSEEATTQTTTSGNNGGNNSGEESSSEESSESSTRTCSYDYFCSGGCQCTSGPADGEICTDPDATTSGDAENCANKCEVCTES